MAQEHSGRPVFDRNHFSQPADVLNIVLDHISQGMVVIGSDYRTLAFNRHFEEMFRLPPGTVEVGVDFRDILRVWARETGQDDAMLERAIRELDLPEHFHFEFAQDIHGELRWCQLTHNPIPGGQGIVRTFTDITERKRLEEELLRLSKTDPLTGLDNRRAIFDTLQAELERSWRHERPLSLLSLDIDHFKHINDTWGHPGGDAVLKAFAQECAACIRQIDRIGRVGGEEFLVILPETGADEARQLAERLRMAIRALRIEPAPEQAPIGITVSIGVSSARAPERIEDLIQRADRALYTAKASGRNRVVSTA